MHIRFRPQQTKELVIFGHPRCGSGFMASFFSSLGYDIGHETMGKHGISSWMFTVDDFIYPFSTNYASSSFFTKFKTEAQHIRNPFDAMPSIVLENRVHQSLKFREKHIKKVFNISLYDYPNELTRAAISFLLWNKLGQTKFPEIVMKIDDILASEKELSSIFNINEGTIRKSLKDDVYKNEGGRDHFLPKTDERSLKKVNFVNMVRPSISPSDYKSLPDWVIEGLRSFCSCYDYKFKI